MFITEQSGVHQWQKMLTENFNISDKTKLSWMAQYAANHEVYESQLGVANGAYVGTGGVGPVYATPLNTTGMGNPAAPGNPNPMSTAPGAVGNLFNQTPGSGDVPTSTLPMALNIALMTVGLELVPTVPMNGPLTYLSYMDFPYAGGKLGRINETSFDGKGVGAENKPIYIKVLATFTNDLRKKLKDGLEVGHVYTIENTVAGALGKATFKGEFKGFGRNDGGLIFKTIEVAYPVGTDFTKNQAAITEVFTNADNKVSLAGFATTGVTHKLTAPVELTGAKADFVTAQADFVDGFANFATGAKEAMTRAQNETGTGNTIGLRIFGKWVQAGSYEVTGTVTRQQLQDLPLYGVDALGKITETMQNEIIQSINARILERVFALGVTNAAQQRMFQGVDLNLYIGAGTATKALATYDGCTYVDIYGVDQKANWGDIKNAEANTSAENMHTRQRRISSRILAAANLIQVTGRRGRATWVVTNPLIATALQDVAGYIIAPTTNTLAQDNQNGLYHAGTLFGLEVYVDPYMAWDDTRVCVGRKGDGNSPGLVFMPYILADTVTVTAEGTMAPKVLVNSRYALVEAGFYPEQQYYTFCVHSDFGFV